MVNVIVPWMAMSLWAGTVSSQPDPSLDTLMERYAGNQDKAQSWIIQYESSQDHYKGEKLEETRQESGEFHFDGQRVLFHNLTSNSPNQSILSEETKPSPNGPPPRDAILLWDGKQHVNYTRSPGKGPGTAYINPHEEAFEIEYLQHINRTGILFGYLGDTFLRLDDLFRRARRGEAHIRRDLLNGVDCFVIEADTVYGRYKVWLDPNHGYNVAKLAVRQIGKDRHMTFDRPLASGFEQSLDIEYPRFEQFADMWLPVEAKWVQEAINEGRRDRYCLDLRVTGFVPNPDPNTLGSFTLDFIQEGATVWLFPTVHIQYTWHNGKPIPQYEKEVVKQLDRVLDEMIQAPPLGPLAAQEGDVSTPLTEAEAGGLQSILIGFDLLGLGTVELDLTPPIPMIAEANAPAMPQSNRPRLRRSHCGLYCIYSMVRLTDQKMDFTELVQSKYMGSYDGSSLPELCRAALDNGLYAVPAARLTPRVLRQSSCPVILHVRGDLDSPKYDHYELFLGTEDGKAKILNPPFAPQLVTFGELAARWDGRGLIVSDRTPDVEVLFTAERQHLLMAAGIVAVGIILIHGTGRTLSTRIGPLSRRWRMALSVGQVAILGMAALVCGLFSNLTNTAGLLDNAEGIRSVQQGHVGGFLPRVGIRQVRRLLDTETAFVDARLSRDYQAGHLKGAISVPIDANEAQRHSATGQLPRNRTIVVYGQSKGCPYAQRMAVRLMKDGFTDVAIFKGGWVEWTARNGHPVAREAEKANGNARGQG